MIKKVLVTLLVTVDTEDEEICPTGDPLAENVVINVLDSANDFLIDGKVKEYCSTIETYSKLLVRFKKQ